MAGWGTGAAVEPMPVTGYLSSGADQPAERAFEQGLK